MRRALVLATALLALVAAGCGGDDEKSAGPEPKTPELSVPGEEAAPTIPDTTGEATGTGTATTPTPGGTAPPPADGGSGGAPTPGGTPTPDGPGNDTPPPAGSPEEQFEARCQQNPAACE